jgi:hypothetical protein
MLKDLACSLVVVMAVVGSVHAQPGGAPVAPPVPPPPPDASAPPPDTTAPDAVAPPAPAPAPGPAPVTAPPPTGPAGPPAGIMLPPPPPSNVDQGTLEDANAGRNWIAPTALMDPAGTWSFSDFELFVVGASYAPTDKISLSAATLIPVFEDQPFIGLFSAKVQVLKVGRVRLAVQAAATLVLDRSDDIDEDGFTAGVLGGAGTLCLDAACRSHLTGYLAAGFARADESAVPFLVSGAGVFKVAKRVKIVVEADSAFVAGDINESADGFIGWYGVRFTSPSIGVDVGLMKPVFFDEGDDDDEFDDQFPLGFPFVSLTYRGLGE